MNCTIYFYDFFPDLLYIFISLIMNGRFQLTTAYLQLACYAELNCVATNHCFTRWHISYKMAPDYDIFQCLGQVIKVLAGLVNVMYIEFINWGRYDMLTSSV